MNFPITVGQLSRPMINLTPLCAIGYKYGSDKCPQLRHTYTPFYYHLLKNRRKKLKKVLEIGIGPYKGRPKRYKESGASLYMWRGFFPNAQIYGADISEEVLVNDTRIKSFLCDARKEADLTSLIDNIGVDIDLVVDDASHELMDQIYTCQKLMPLLKKDVIYIIEDVAFSRKLSSALSAYKVVVPAIAKQNASNQLVVVTNN